MSFWRAVIVAFMAAGFTAALQSYPDEGWFAIVLVTWAIGGFLWSFSDDPLPDATRRGLEAYARTYRK